MFALAHDGSKIFLHQPDAGMVVPILLDLRNKHITVRVPSIDELENDYAIYDELSDLLLAVDYRYHTEITFARSVSQECSIAYRDQISTDKLTVSELRWLFEDHLRRAAARENMATPSGSSNYVEDDAARSFSGGEALTSAH